MYKSGWEDGYYREQAGSGFATFSGHRYQRGRGFSTYSGVRYQKGRGFFGRIWKSVTLPLLKYIGKNGLEAAGNIVRDVATKPDSIKDIVSEEMKRVSTKAIADGGERVTKFIQTGKGTVALTHRPPHKIYKRNPSSTKSKLPPLTPLVSVSEKRKSFLK